MWEQTFTKGVPSLINSVIQFFQAAINLALRYPVILVIFVLMILGISSKGKVKLFGQEISIG